MRSARRSRSPSGGCDSRASSASPAAMRAARIWSVSAAPGRLGTGIFPSADAQRLGGGPQLVDRRRRARPAGVAEDHHQRAPGPLARQAFDQDRQLMGDGGRDHLLEGDLPFVAGEGHASAQD